MATSRMKSFYMCNFYLRLKLDTSEKWCLIIKLYSFFNTFFVIDLSSDELIWKCILRKLHQYVIKSRRNNQFMTHDKDAMAQKRHRNSFIDHINANIYIKKVRLRFNSSLMLKFPPRLSFRSFAPVVTTKRTQIQL